jgi:hypothetical protein
MAYVNKRSGKNVAKRFTGLYKAVDGTYKSAGTFDTEERALEVAQAAERHASASTTHFRTSLRRSSSASGSLRARGCAS